MTPDSYDINDPVKIQGRDEVFIEDRSLAALRLQYALAALPDSCQWILMPGAGAGRYARAMARHFPEARITGGDLSETAIQEATAAGGGPTYSVFDVTEIPAATGSYDALVFFDLLEHVPSPESALDECFRVLRPGGVLHFYVPLERQPGSVYALLREDQPIPIHAWKRYHVGHIQRFTSADVLALCWLAGFQVVEISHSFHLAGQLLDLVDYWNRDRNRGGAGRMPVPAVNLISRLTMMAAWRLAYIEDRLYSGPLLASGLHVSAIKPADS